MTTRDDLLRAVLAEPDSDAPRLVLADFLDDDADARGEPLPCPRAEFVRVQCELADPGAALRRFVGGGGDRRLISLRRRERELLCHLCFVLAAELPFGPSRLNVCLEADPRSVLPQCVFRRGFVEVVTLDAGAWLAHADALRAAAPLREVRLTGRLGARCWVDPSYGPLGVLTADDPTADLPLREVSRTVAYPNRSDAPPVEQLLTVLWPGVRFVLPTT